MNPYDFSPGPWHVDADPRNPNDTLCDHICEANGNAICFMASKHDGNADEMEANARAIGAVPELVAACVESLNCCYEQHSELGEQLQTALAKAGIKQSQLPIKETLT